LGWSRFWFFVFALTEIFRRLWRVCPLIEAGEICHQPRDSWFDSRDDQFRINDALFFIFIVAFFSAFVMASPSQPRRPIGPVSYSTWAVLTLQRSSTPFAVSIRSRECSNGWATAFSQSHALPLACGCGRKVPPSTELPRRARSAGSSGDDTSGSDGEKVSLNKMIAIAGIPWDENSSFLRGPSEAPPLIRAALFSEASGLRSESGIDFPPDLFVDAGDVPVLTGRAMIAAIEDFIAALLDRDLSPLSLGGDHAVTYPIIAFSRKYRDLTPPIDAHADLYDTFEGNRYSHACPFARIMEEGLAKRLVQVASGP
jgi:hypothetical protein